MDNIAMVSALYSRCIFNECFEDYDCVTNTHDETALAVRVELENTIYDLDLDYEYNFIHRVFEDWLDRVFEHTTIESDNALMELVGKRKFRKIVEIWVRKYRNNEKIFAA